MPKGLEFRRVLFCSAEAHYNVADVLVDGVSVGAVTSYTFNSVAANQTIDASFTIDTYTITASAGANGAIAPPGVTTINYGGSQDRMSVVEGKTMDAEGTGVQTCALLLCRRALSRRRRAGGWRERRCGDVVHIQQRGGEPHD